MRRPIIGITVGTPISPATIEKRLNHVKTVNGIEPDENGNVTVSGGGGDIEFATDEEVTKSLEAIYGEGSGDDSGNTPGDGPSDTPEDDPAISDDDFATNEEVEDMIDDIFGG